MKTDNLKNIITTVDGLIESIANLKKDLNGGDKMAEVIKEEKVVASEEEVKVEEAKAEEVVVAEETKVEEAKAEEEVKTEETVVVAEEVKEEVAVAEEVKTEEVVVAEEVKAEEVKSEASEMTVTEEAKAIAAAELAGKIEPLVKTVAADVVAGLELTEEEKSIATDKSFVDLVKMVSELTKEVAEFRKMDKEKEEKALAESRYNELKEAGLAIVTAKASAQREKISKMSEEAFASYKEELANVKESLTTSGKAEIEQARKDLGGKSIATTLTVADRKTKFRLMF